MKLAFYNLTKGDHTLTITYREDGACLDKLCITNNEIAPSAMGETDSLSLGINSLREIDDFHLGQNYPNPFNPTTTISFSIPFQSFVSLKIYDTLGREVSTLLSEKLPAGTYSPQWNASGLPSGVYFYRLLTQPISGQVGSFARTKKLVLLR